MIRVMDLHPGDKLIIPTMDGDDTGIFIGTVKPHPLYPTLWMVIWWMVERKEWMHDALLPQQELPGRLDPTSRQANLSYALHPGKYSGTDPFGQRA